MEFYKMQNRCFKVNLILSIRLIIIPLIFYKYVLANNIHYHKYFKIHKLLLRFI